MSAREDRRKRAREAACGDPHSFNGRVDVEAAIETATRVRITDQLIGRASSTANDLIFFRGDAEMPTPEERWRIILTAVFEAAGFEVEE